MPWGSFVRRPEFRDKSSSNTIPDKLFAPRRRQNFIRSRVRLDAFGPDYRFQTPISIVRRGEVDANGDLTGDLILIASGDLTLGGRTAADGTIAFRNSDHTYANGNLEAALTDEDPLAGLNELAKQVAASGIKHVRGDVLIDDRLFEKAESSGSGPSNVTPIMQINRQCH